MAFIWGEGFGTASTDVANLQFKIFIGGKLAELQAIASSGRISPEILEKAKEMKLESALLAPLAEIAGNKKLMDIDSKKLYDRLRIMAKRIADKHPIAISGQLGEETGKAIVANLVRQAHNAKGRVRIAFLGKLRNALLGMGQHGKLTPVIAMFDNPGNSLRTKMSDLIRADPSLQTAIHNALYENMGALAAAKVQKEEDMSVAVNDMKKFQGAVIQTTLLQKQPKAILVSSVESALFVINTAGRLVMHNRSLPIARPGRTVAYSGPRLSILPKSTA